QVAEEAHSQPHERPDRRRGDGSSGQRGPSEPERQPHNPTNAEINAAETGNPASVDYGKDPKEVLKEKWRRDRLRPKLGAGRSGAGRGRGVEFRSEFVGRPTHGEAARSGTRLNAVRYRLAYSKSVSRRP